MDLARLTIDDLAAAGITLAKLARVSEVRYPALQRALAQGYGWNNLTPDEQARVQRALYALGFLVRTPSPAPALAGKSPTSHTASEP